MVYSYQPRVDRGAGTATDRDVQIQETSVPEENACQNGSLEENSRGHGEFGSLHSPAACQKK